MNKIYKVIFNHRLGNFVVVSELAKSCGKTQSVASEQPVSRFNPFSFLLKTLTAGILLALGTVQTVMADSQEVSMIFAPGTVLEVNKDGSLTVVKRDTNLTDNSKQTQATAAAGYTAIYAKDGASYASKLQGEGLVFNNSTKPSGYVGIGLGKDVTVGSENSIAIGYKATATNMRNDRSGSIAIGQESIATSMSSLALGNNARSLFSRRDCNWR